MSVARISDELMLVIARRVCATMAEAMNAESRRLSMDGLDERFIEIALTIASRRVAKTLYEASVKTLPSDVFRKVLSLSDSEHVRLTTVEAANVPAAKA